MLSLDLLAGFTIFLLALIMVVSMVPGLLAGLESSSIDYDAVAYRTGVILVEDPGWPVYPPWESYNEDQKEEIIRMGLAISRDTPNILLSTKVEKFFNRTLFDDDDYRNKAIFGDIPYSYNFSLNTSNPDGTYELKQTGSPMPPGYGYIRRVVKIKEPGVAEIDKSFKDQYTISDPPGDEGSSTARNFTVRLDFSHLLDPAINPIYQIDPRTEPVNVTITDFGGYLNGTYEDATLANVTTSWKAGRDFPPVSLPWLSFSEEKPDSYTLYLDGDSHNLTPNTSVNSSISLVLKPAAISPLLLDQNSILDIRFNFDDDPPRTNITGTHLYDYNATNVTHLDLKTAVLEVAIW
ncbi:MAG: hypothetical protein HQP72_04875 [Methanoculleus sp.]|nr:hypothetical protein [Methanoculleus sp.]